MRCHMICMDTSSRDKTHGYRADLHWSWSGRGGWCGHGWTTSSGHTATCFKTYLPGTLDTKQTIAWFWGVSTAVPRESTNNTSGWSLRYFYAPQQYQHRRILCSQNLGNPSPRHTGHIDVVHPGYWRKPSVRWMPESHYAGPQRATRHKPGCWDDATRILSARKWI